MFISVRCAPAYVSPAQVVPSTRSCYSVAIYGHAQAAEDIDCIRAVGPSPAYARGTQSKHMHRPSTKFDCNIYFILILYDKPRSNLISRKFSVEFQDEIFKPGLPKILKLVTIDRFAPKNSKHDFQSDFMNNAGSQCFSTSITQIDILRFWSSARLLYRSFFSLSAVSGRGPDFGLSHSSLPNQNTR